MPPTGRRPALVLSPQSYNGTVGLAIFCPVTNQVKGYPFEVALPFGSTTRSRFHRHGMFAQYELAYVEEWHGSPVLSPATGTVRAPA